MRCMLAKHCNLASLSVSVDTWLWKKKKALGTERDWIESLLWFLLVIVIGAGGGSWKCVSENIPYNPQSPQTSGED